MDDSNAPATKADLAELALATKADLAKLATKEEIAKLATKEEIAKLATKEEIAKLATKEEFHRLAMDQARLRGELVAMEDRLTQRYEAGISRVIQTVEGFAAKSRDLDRRTLVHRDRLDGHEKRLRSLERRKS